MTAFGYLIFGKRPGEDEPPLPLFLSPRRGSQVVSERSELIWSWVRDLLGLRRVRPQRILWFSVSTRIQNSSSRGMFQITKKLIYFFFWGKQ